MAEDPISVLERELVHAARRRAAGASARQAVVLPVQLGSAIVIGSFAERRQAQMRREHRFSWTGATLLVALVVFVGASILLLVVQ